MNEFLTIVEFFVKNVLEQGREVDETLVEELLHQGLEISEIENAFTILFNLLVNRNLTEKRRSGPRFRHLTEDEERELGSNIVSCLQFLQLCGLLSPSDMDYLIYGYLENRVSGDDENEFWRLLEFYRPDAFEYLKISSKGEGQKISYYH